MPQCVAMLSGIEGYSYAENAKDSIINPKASHLVLFILNR
jgi:hypothetical protein